MGWKGKRQGYENSLHALGKKAPVEITNNKEWKAHYRSFGTKYLYKATKQKGLLVDLGLVIYDGKKEATYQETLKPKGEKRRRSVGVTPSKNIFTSPDILSIDIMASIELQPDLKQEKTLSATPLETIEVKFRKYFMKSKNESGSSTDCEASVDDNHSTTSSSDRFFFCRNGKSGQKG